MKYFLSVLLIVGIGLIFLFCPMIKTEGQTQYLRIHIRANSNSVIDQTVKYKVKDEIVETLIPLLSQVKTFDQAKEKLVNNFSLIEWTANKVLKNEGVDYRSNARLDNEYFPTKTYNNITLKAGYYDALILDLGSGQGNNWWCIVFPTFCFTNSQNSDNFEYISLIWEIIKSVT